MYFEAYYGAFYVLLAVASPRVGLGTYIAAAAIGMRPATALYVYLGSLAPTAAQISTAAEAGGAGRLGLYITGLAATMVVVVIATRAAKRALRAELDRAA